MRDCLTRRLLPVALAFCMAPFVIAQADEATGETAAGLVNEARRLYADADFSGAAGKLERALELDAAHLPARQWLAVALHAAGDREAAREHYEAVQGASFRPPVGGATDAQRAARALVIRCEALLVALLNDERRDEGLPLLLPDLRLSVIARAHSEEMRDLSYFSHQSPTPGRRTIKDRFLGVVRGARSYSIGENIARRYATGAYSLSPEAVTNTHREWMESKGHRANILGEGFERIGIGIAVNDNGDYWATQFFARY